MGTGSGAVTHDEVRLLEPGDRVRVTDAVPNPLYHGRAGEFVGAWSGQWVGARKYRVRLDGELGWVEFRPGELERE